MRVFSCFLLAFLLLACESGEGKKDKHKPSVYHPIKDKLFYKQWYLAENESFYDEKSIDKNAHIHPGKMLNKYRGYGVKIAIIDDGLYPYNQDLKDAINEIRTLAGKPLIKSPHGTAVAGLIGAEANKKGIFGLASSSEIIFLQLSQRMSDEETISLFKQAVKFGADVINCSWGSGEVSEGLKEYIKHISNNERGGKGIVVVFSVGNDSSLIPSNDESSIEEVIAVGATNSLNERSFYSNHGQSLDLVAPGGDFIGMISTGVGKNVYKEDFRGTSAATPLVTSLIALMLEANPNLTRKQINTILAQSADKIGDISYDKDGRNDYYGYGKINLKASIENSLKP